MGKSLSLLNVHAHYYFDLFPLTWLSDVDEEDNNDDNDDNDDDDNDDHNNDDVDDKRRSGHFSSAANPVNYFFSAQ